MDDHEWRKQLDARVRFQRIPLHERVITRALAPAVYPPCWAEWKDVISNQFFTVDGISAIRPYGQPWRTFDEDSGTFPDMTVEDLFCDNGAVAAVLSDALDACLRQQRA